MSGRELTRKSRDLAERAQRIYLAAAMLLKRVPDKRCLLPRRWSSSSGSAKPHLFHRCYTPLRGS